MSWDLAAAVTISRASGTSRSGCRLVSGFVEHQQLRQTRGEQRRDPQQVSQGAVGQFGGAQRALQSGLGEAQVEPPWLIPRHAQPTSGEGQVDGGVQRQDVTDLADRLERRREVRAVMAEHGSPGADRTLSPAILRKVMAQMTTGDENRRTRAATALALALATLVGRGRTTRRACRRRETVERADRDRAVHERSHREVVRLPRAGETRCQRPVRITLAIRDAG